jgi:hypothetical protein
MKIFPLPFMYCSNLSCKFSRQTQKKLVGFSHHGHFSVCSLYGSNYKPAADTMTLKAAHSASQLDVCRLDEDYDEDVFFAFEGRHHHTVG